MCLIYKFKYNILKTWFSVLFIFLRAQETFLQWDQCRRIYNFLMADNMKKSFYLTGKSLLY